jgi:porin
MFLNNVSTWRHGFVLFAIVFFSIMGVASAQAEAAPSSTTVAEAAPATTAPSSGWLERDTMTGDWGGRRTSLKEEYGITIKPRFTQFFQGMPSGDGDHDPQYGSKLDVLLNADMNKLGLWKGLFMAVHAEYNSNNRILGNGGAISPVNTALFFPGIEGAETFDLSSVYLAQMFSKDVTLLAGKMNVIDLASIKPFMGGAGIDSFWNLVFVAPPSGAVPPYLVGAMLSVRTDAATYGLWVYDPNHCERVSCIENGFDQGVSIRPSVEFPVTIAGLSGHQGFAFVYSNQKGTDLESIKDTRIPRWPAGATTKNDRYFFSYSFDQYLYQSKKDPQQGFGLFGQFGISDGNPNNLRSLAMIGLGGMGLVPGRSRDNWGIGYYYITPSDDLKDSLALGEILQDEQAVEIFYNFAVTPWFTVGPDVQFINPGLEEKNSVFTGLRTVVRF